MMCKALLCTCIHLVDVYAKLALPYWNSKSEKLIGFKFQFEMLSNIVSFVGQERRQYVYDYDYIQSEFLSTII